MYNKRLIIGLVCLFAGALSGFPATAVASSNEPSWLEIHVFSKQTGEAVSGAAVCLGTSARPDQFGAKRSDDNGVVRFEDLLRNPLIVTVSKQGFQGRQQRLEPLYQSRVLVLKVAPGGGGAECDAPGQPQSTTSSGLLIEGVNVRADPAAAGHVLVSVSVFGQANQIRISEQAEFTGASWETFQSPISYALSQGGGMKQIYVQIRRFAQAEGASMEVISPVVRTQYRLH